MVQYTRTCKHIATGVVEARFRGTFSGDNTVYDPGVVKVFVEEIFGFVRK